MAVEWINIKNDWNANSSFEPEDYNRIANNLRYLNERLSNPIELQAMPTKVYDYNLWDAEEFNVLENNLHNININFNGGSTQIGLKKVFYPNGAFISAAELNRIENGLQMIKDNQEIVNANRRRIPFELGQYKQPRF